MESVSLKFFESFLQGFFIDIGGVFEAKHATYQIVVHRIAYIVSNCFAQDGISGFEEFPIFGGVEGVGAVDDGEQGDEGLVMGDDLFSEWPFGCIFDGEGPGS
mmetsp:Transcript_28042/g.36237  ORF Transcript_28042/g.36237 Transcript_28042/m.36237 type:complete len:103 (-) Transcript_28042:504-812(-)